MTQPQSTSHTSDSATTNSLAEQWQAPKIHRVVAPLREQVVESLREAIHEHRLQAGQRLIERELIEQFNVSRTTIREAIRFLSAQGLVTVVPQKGAIVATSSLENVMDYYEVRAQIEALLVRRFTERATEEELDELVDTVTHLQSVTSSTSNVNEVLRAKDEFYKVLFAGARSEAMQQVLDSIHDRVQYLRSLSVAVPGRSEQMIAEMHDIAQTAHRREADKAAELMTIHVQNAAATALKASQKEGSY